MTLMCLIRNVLVAFLLASSQLAFATETIDWQSLVPPLDDSKDLYSQLPEELQESAYDLWWATNQQAEGNNIGPIKEVAESSRAKLEENGIDVDALLKGIIAFADLIEANGTKLVEDLNGKKVKMPGYVLPIEYSGNLVVEFLLVPYVGACVHTPPPPPNQMVHVKLNQGFESEGLFMPVWVTGQMSTAMSSQVVSFEDGSTDVETGYTITAVDVVPYE